MLNKIRNGEIKIAIIGLGYVGFPLAVEFGKRFDTIGYDKKESRLASLKQGIDETLEIPTDEIQSSHRLRYTSNPSDLRDRDIIIITVPTPVDKHNSPDLVPLFRASETAGKVMKRDAIIIYESTVYPGCTEEDCVPILEHFSGLKFNKDFFCGYSPERINPGDKEHTLTKVVKITSGSTPETAEAVDALYNSILQNGTHRASSIKVAEAAKVIENSQRDLNIAFVNELAKIFRLIGIDTHEVLEAAGTKWNFLKFSPGLVGGHCIGVDPYYLTHKSLSLGYLPEVILSGRRINDGMGKYISTEIIKLMIRKGVKILNSNVLLLGITFKENCPDIRNSKAVDVAVGLQEFGCLVDIFDPWANPDEIKKEYGLNSTKRISDLRLNGYSAIVLTVAHEMFLHLNLNQYRDDNSVVFDIKGVLPRSIIHERL